MYFVIGCDEDGTTVEQKTRAEIEGLLSEAAENDQMFFIESLASNDPDPNYWGGGRLIIKGEIVVPRAVKVVEKFEID